MSSADRAIYIDLGWGTPTTGLWCAKCNLPSGIEVPVLHSLSPDGINHLAQWKFCNGCKAEL